MVLRLPISSRFAGFRKIVPFLTATSRTLKSVSSPLLNWVPLYFLEYRAAHSLQSDCVIYLGVNDASSGHVLRIDRTIRLRYLSVSGLMSTLRGFALQIDR